MALTETSTDRLIEALLCQALAVRADRLALAFEPLPDTDMVQSCARCWRGEEALADLPLSFAALGLLTRRVLLLARLDPWQFRRPQSGVLETPGRWAVEVAGEDARRRRVTLRLLEPVEVEARDWAERARAAALELAGGPAPEEGEERRTSLAELEAESPVVRLANLILLQGLRQGALEIVIEPVDEGMAVDLIFADGSRWPEMRPPVTIAPSLRRRLLLMAGLDPWQQSPARGAITLRLGHGAEAIFALDLEPGEAIRLRVVSSVEPPREGEDGFAGSSALLESVLEHPDDDERRQVYADWLQERGIPHGQFIARQFALDTPDAPPPSAAQGWCGALRLLAGVESMRFSRGFLERLVVTRSPPATRWDAIVADPHWSTVQGLRFQHASDRLVWRILREARLASLEALVLSSRSLGRLEPAELPRLQSLGVSGALDGPALHALERLALPRLRRLELWADPLMAGLADIGEDGPGEEEDWLAPLLEAPLCARLPELALLRWDTPEPGEIGRLARRLPDSVMRLHLVLADDLSAAFPGALLCTLYRPEPDAPMVRAALRGPAEVLARRAPALLRALAPLSALHAAPTSGLLSIEQKHALRLAAGAPGGRTATGVEVDPGSFLLVRLGTPS